MELEPIEIFNGISELIFVLVAVVLGCLVVAKSRKAKKKILLIVGLVWIGISLPWAAGVVSFFYTLLTGEMISVFVYLFIGFVFLPFTMFMWCYAFSELVYKEKQLIILLVMGIGGGLFEIIFLYLLFTDTSALATLHSPLVIEYKLLIQLYLLSVIVVALLTGSLFANKTKQIGDPEQKLRGNLLLFAFILLTIGSLLDIIYIENVLFIIIKRLVFIIASFSFYFSFILPDWFKKFFLS